MRKLGTATVAFLFTATLGYAHVNMLLPDKAWAEKGEKVTFIYQFGHPYEHELSDAPKPEMLLVTSPKRGEETLDIDKLLKPIKKDGADGKKVTAWEFTYTPQDRGDHVFVLKTPAIKHGDDLVVEDLVRVVLHVQTQNFDYFERIPFSDRLDMLPDTRPYGLLPGMVFKGRAVASKIKRDVNTGHLLVEIEKYNPAPPKKLPPDELITFRSKTDIHGYFVTTLPEAGWWGITANGWRRKKDEVLQRVTHWVYVNEKK